MSGLADTLTEVSADGLPGSPRWERRTVVVEGLTTSFLEAGAGDPLVLLHGGEFGASAELGWERNIATLAERYRVIAPDQIGYGHTAKVIDFNEGRTLRIRHLAKLLALLGIDEARFVGNSMGGLNLLVDQTSERPQLPVTSMVLICGGGEILRNRFTDALFEYDATFEGMRKIVEALFHGSAYPADDAYVQRRYDSSVLPGAWEAIAAARFKRPAGEISTGPKREPQLDRIGVPTVFVEGGKDKLKPPGWAAGLAAQAPGARSTVIAGAGHCPQIEQPDAIHELLLEFFAERSS